MNELRPEVERCLGKRDELQQKIDEWYAEKKASGADLAKTEHRQPCRDFLRDIGYLVPDKGPVSVTTQFVDDEIAKVPAPQLVVPSDNARYVLNAVNARWGSLYDALYGFDVIPAYSVTSTGVEINAAKGASGYNPMRGHDLHRYTKTIVFCR